MNIIKDLISVISSLSVIDYILYFSVLVLIILIIALIYILKSDEVEMPNNGSDEMNNEPDLSLIASQIDENKTPIIDMTAYEEEQEQKAIISYDELLKEKNKKQISYDEERLIDDCIPTKKINLTEIISDQNNIPEATIFHYEKQEAFLQTLKELNRLLN